VAIEIEEGGPDGSSQMKNENDKISKEKKKSGDKKKKSPALWIMNLGVNKAE
jgi:hypothetical protein